MRIKILQQLNGAHGTFDAGHIVELPEHVATAWIDAGVAERAVPEPVSEPSEPDDAPGPLPDDDGNPDEHIPADDGKPLTKHAQPPVTPQPRRRNPPRSAHPSSHDGPTWSGTGPG